MSKTAKVKDVIWNEFGGGLCAIFRAQDSIRREISIAVPAGSLQRVSAEARRRLAAERTKNEKSWMPPQWHHVNFLSIQTILVGTTDDQKVGIILDQALETEFGLSIQPEHARELGRQLIAQADQASSMNPKMN
jgi:hypothetical protein